MTNQEYVGKNDVPHGWKQENKKFNLNENICHQYTVPVRIKRMTPPTPKQPIESATNTE